MGEVGDGLGHPLGLYMKVGKQFKKRNNYSQANMGGAVGSSNQRVSLELSLDINLSAHSCSYQTQFKADG